MTVKIQFKYLFPILFMAFSCQTGVKKSSAQQQDSLAYDLTKREAIALPNEIREVSGQTFVGTDYQSLYMIQDENGIIYQYDLSSKRIANQIPFAKDADYEDITTDDTYFFVLESNGDIHKRAIVSTIESESVRYRNLLPKGEYESLYYRKDIDKLFVVCKQCKGDRKNNRVSGYILRADKQDNFVLESEFYLDLHQAKTLYKKFPKTFEPSAISYLPSKKEWYIVSSIDKMIVVTDESFHPKQVLHFSRKDYEQPEGLAFNDKGSMFLSSEAGDKDTAMLYIINPL